MNENYRRLRQAEARDPAESEADSLPGAARDIQRRWRMDRQSRTSALRKLTVKREFCLRKVAEGYKTSLQVSRKAREAGINRRLSWSEWADEPLRHLREDGLIAKTGRRINGRAEHRITDLGLDVLDDLDE